MLSHRWPDVIWVGLVKIGYWVSFVEGEEEMEFCWGKGREEGMRGEREEPEGEEMEAELMTMIWTHLSGDVRGFWLS